MNKETTSAKQFLLEASIFKEASSYSIHKVLVALSGGADSVATAFALHQANLHVIALHCNFHLRGDESNRDMNFVVQFCEKLGIPLEIKEFDVNKFLKQNKGTSVEMACRDLRYSWFRDKLEETGADRLVTGHNADDNIETFFLNLLRGAGTRGLKAMSSDNGIIWRPLLKFHRKDILAYLKAHNLSYVVDSTNLENDYRRNFLRNNIIPQLKEKWKGFDSALDKTIRNLQDENKLVEEVINSTLPLPNQPLSTSVILSHHSPLLLLKRYIDPLGPFATTPSEVLSAIKANKPHIRKWRLKKGVLFLRNGNLFIEMGHGECCT